MPLGCIKEFAADDCCKWQGTHHIENFLGMVRLGCMKITLRYFLDHLLNNILPGKIELDNWIEVKLENS